MRDCLRRLRSRATLQSRNKRLQVGVGNIIMLVICPVYFHGYGLNAIQRMYGEGDTGNHEG